MEQLESRQLLTAYYIDPVLGSDSNPGTLKSPFRTARNLSSWTADEGNKTFQKLDDGDTVYLREGVHDWSALLASNPKLTSDVSKGAWELQNVHGRESTPITIQAFHGEHPIIRAKVDGAEGAAIHIEQSSHVKILGLEVTGTYGPGIVVSEASGIEIARNYIHDVDGKRCNNSAGIYTADVVGLHIHHNLLHDNYDRKNAQEGEATENNRNIVIFGDGSDRVEVDHNKIFNTPRPDGHATGAGVFIKHDSKIPNARFEIHDNIIRDVYFTAIGSQASNVLVKNNLIVNGAPFIAFGGDNVTTLRDFVFAYNSWVGTTAISLYQCTGLIPSSGLLQFSQNIVEEGQQRCTNDDGCIIRLDPYGGDSDYDRAVSPQNLAFDGNVYFNPQTTTMFNVYGANGDQYGERGAIHDFAGWRDLGRNWPKGLDRHSIVADPRFDDSFIPTNLAAQHAGYWASDKPRLAMYVPKDAFLESAGANASFVTVVRSGMSLASPLTVTLRTSDATEARLPASVTFPAGASVLRVPIAAVDDNRKEPTGAVQLFADASGGLQASEWVRVLQDDNPAGNRAPILAPIVALSALPGQVATFTTTATDPDGDRLTYSLNSGAPAGAAIVAATGVFTWTPPLSQPPGESSVTVRVTDNGSPPLTDSQAVAITVKPSALPQLSVADASTGHAGAGGRRGDRPQRRCSIANLRC